MDIEFPCTECVSFSDELIVVGWDRFREVIRMPPQMKQSEYWWVIKCGYFFAFLMAATLIAALLTGKFKLMARVYEIWQLTLYTHMLARDIPATTLLFSQCLFPIANLDFTFSK